MKKLIPLLFLLILSYSCSHEESLSPVSGTATFSLSPPTSTSKGGRISEASVPAFVQFSIRDSNGKMQENLTLSLFAFGQSYTSENLQLQTGTYQLTQFKVLDEHNKVIYATPLAGSDFAKYVTHPLPLDFTIAEDQTTQVLPQVLIVSNEDTPESFGLVSFGFEVIQVAVVKVPLTGVEEITKVSYQFSNGTKVISSEIIHPDLILELNIPELLTKTWQTRILVWTDAKDCYQKVYRYSGELAFDGSVLQLPSLETTNWTPFYYTEKDKVGIFRSVDPRTSYQVEVQLPPGVDGYGYVDRGYYNDEEDALCDNQLFAELHNANSNGLIKVSIPDQTTCDLNELGLVDSFLTINILTQDVQIQSIFYWEVKDGIVKPLCQ